MTLQISQLASKTGLSIHTLRYYEKEGILPPAKRNASGIRIYDSEDIEWIKFACCLRDSGMGIADMKKFAQLVLQGEETRPERVQMLRLQNERIQAQIGQLKRFKENIQYKIDFYSS